jgi:hypothetical protein
MLLSGGRIRCDIEIISNGKADNITDGLREMWKQEYEKYKDIIQEEVTVKCDIILQSN